MENKNNPRNKLVMIANEIYKRNHHNRLAKVFPVIFLSFCRVLEK